MTTSRSSGKRAHSRTSRIAVSKVPTWLRSLATQLQHGRDVVLLIADGPGQQQLADMLRPIAREVITASGLVDAKQVLQRRGSQIAAAVISSQPDWGLQLRPLLAAEYPEIRRVVLIG